MNTGKYIFAQLIEFLPQRIFDRIVMKYEGNKYVKHFTCWNQLLVMMFGQLSNRDSLRDLTNTVSAHSNKVYHLGFGKNVTRSNLAKVNERREPRIFEEFSYHMIDIARKNRIDKDFEIDGKVFAFDSTTIDLCLSVFWWAKFHHGKGAFKMHTLLDVKNNIPNFIMLIPGYVHDTQAMDSLPVEAGAYYLMDKGYVDFDRLFRIFQQQKAYLVTRAKDNMRYSVFEAREVDRQTGVISDESISLTGLFTAKKYPDLLRMVVYEDFAQNVVYRFLTNDFTLEAITIAELYRERWTIETFFKWIKQHLKIKSFWGTTETAVRIQIYSAITAYCMVAIVEHDLKLHRSTYEVLRILSASLLDKTPIKELFTKEPGYVVDDCQLTLNFI